MSDEQPDKTLDRRELLGAAGAVAAGGLLLAEAVAETPGLRLDPPDVETNLVWFHVDPDLGSAQDVAAALKQRGVLVQPAGPQTIRACTHLDVSAAQAERAAEAILQVVPRRVAALRV